MALRLPAPVSPEGRTAPPPPALWPAAPPGVPGDLGHAAETFIYTVCKDLVKSLLATTETRS